MSSWPAVISPDEDNEYLILDYEGDVTKYHVEFYGKPRTHSWITAKRVESYGSGNAPKGKNLGWSKGKGNTTSKKRFAKAVAEANATLSLTLEERLKSCVFQPIDKTEIPFIKTEGTLLISQ